MAGFFVDAAELDFLGIHIPVVDHPRAAGFALSPAGDSDFSETTSARDQVAGIGCENEAVFLCDQFVLAEHLVNLAAECERLGEDHGLKNGLFGYKVKFPNKEVWNASNTATPIPPGKLAAQIRRCWRRCSQAVIIHILESLALRGGSVFAECLCIFGRFPQPAEFFHG